MTISSIVQKRPKTVYWYTWKIPVIKKVKQFANLGSNPSTSQSKFSPFAGFE
jgi:hypothetical protein